ncbi:hypothetical protein GW17_00032807 [Ensete ventricosum]|uniref:Uncharacterized protein n=1 Tax=Ensete ventricosum TaxID=4639 RepID=A0A444E0Y1_ENSVE|nr:hypothetical protein GW17_00032807 [Ensete ventricosum]RZR75151.1 hypothetical protein BHM03_00050636 [Ensete ventricosum]
MGGCAIALDGRTGTAASCSSSCGHSARKRLHCRRALPLWALPLWALLMLAGGASMGVDHLQADHGRCPCGHPCRGPGHGRRPLSSLPSL